MQHAHAMAQAGTLLTPGRSLPFIELVLANTHICVCCLLLMYLCTWVGFLLRCISAGWHQACCEGSMEVAFFCSCMLVALAARGLARPAVLFLSLKLTPLLYRIVKYLLESCWVLCQQGCMCRLFCRTTAPACSLHG